MYICNSLQWTPLFSFLFRDMRLSDRTTQHGRKKQQHIFPDYSVCMLDVLTEVWAPSSLKNMPKLLMLHKYR